MLNISQEKYDNTVKECTKALDLNPVYIKALVRRGEANEKLEHFEEAIAVKTCPYEKRSVPIQQQQQQLLLNGKEIRNSDELRAIGVKDDNLFVMVRFGVGSGGGGAASCLVDEELSKKYELSTIKRLQDTSYYSQAYDSYVQRTFVRGQ
ncbi:hypothetical protein S245_008252, partial [Arachis hypogaea]